jgi:HK97 family phage portal protein
MNPAIKIWNAMRTVLRRFTGGTSIFVSPRAAGVYVNEEIALTYGPVWDCVHCIADSIAMLPWHVHERLGPGKGRRIRDDIALDWLLNVQPNPEQTAFQFLQFFISSALLWGNGYAEIVRDAAGRPIALWPLLPSVVTPMRLSVGGPLIYRVRGQDGMVDLPASDVLHLAGLGYDGLVGYSVIRMAARSIGVGLAMEQFAAGFFANGTHPSGILTTEAILNQTQIELTRKNWEDTHGGPYKAGKTAIMFGGLKWQSLTMPMQDAQFLENRKWQIEDIARWFRIPPHKIGDLEHAKYANIEQQSIEFVTDCLMPWVVNMEQMANSKLIGRNNQGKLFTKINVNALVRGDMATRYAAYGIAKDKGLMSTNDIRELEDLNPVPGGDDYYVQMQMIPIDMVRDLLNAKIKQTSQPPAQNAPAQSDQQSGDGQSSDQATQNLLRVITR